MIYDVLKEDMHSDDDAGYSHSDPPEETMPYIADQQFDSWAEDTPAAVRSDVPLPGWLTDLRDGTAVDPPQVGLARQQRLTQMERDIAACVDFITDCERYGEALNHYPNPCVGDLVPRMMGQHLRELTGRALHKHKHLRAELAILRRQG